MTERERKQYEKVVFLDIKWPRERKKYIILQLSSQDWMVDWNLILIKFEYVIFHTKFYKVNGENSDAAFLLGYLIYIHFELIVDIYLFGVELLLLPEPGTLVNAVCVASSCAKKNYSIALLFSQ